MKFYSNRDPSTGSLFVNGESYDRAWLLERDWDFADNQQGVEFELLMHDYFIDEWNNHNKSMYNPRQRSLAIHGLHRLPNIKKLMYPEFYTNVSTDQNNSVLYIDRGKPDTLISLSSGSWVNTVTRNLLEHQVGYMLDKVTDYNVISIIEDYTRTVDNPILYDSCMYDGINYEINSTTKLVEYIKNLIPNTNYHILADCKNGHSSCLIAHELGASRVLIQSGISNCEYEQELKQFSRVEFDNRYNLYEWNDLRFQVLLRQMHFCKDIPDKFKSINSIAEVTPNCEFTYVYCDKDDSLYRYIDSVTDTENVNKVPLAPTAYTFGNHYITIELENSGYFDRYFSDSW